jgi:hypothetical protein
MGQITAINMFYLNELAPLVFKTERIPNASPTGYCDRGDTPPLKLLKRNLILARKEN